MKSDALGLILTVEPSDLYVLEFDIWINQIACQLTCLQENERRFVSNSWYE